MKESKSIYIEGLRNLIIKIQEGNKDKETLEMLEVARKQTCCGYNDRLALDELIENAEEYLSLEDGYVKKRGLTETEKERRSYLVGWFDELNSDLKEQKTTLWEIYNQIKLPSNKFKCWQNL